MTGIDRFQEAAQRVASQLDNSQQPMEWVDAQIYPDPVGRSTGGISDF